MKSANSEFYVYFTRPILVYFSSKPIFPLFLWFPEKYALDPNVPYIGTSQTKIRNVCLSAILEFLLSVAYTNLEPWNIYQKYRILFKIILTQLDFFIFETVFRQITTCSDSWFESYSILSTKSVLKLQSEPRKKTLGKLHIYH